MKRAKEKGRWEKVMDFLRGVREGVRVCEWKWLRREKRRMKETRDREGVQGWLVVWRGSAVVNKKQCKQNHMLFIVCQI